MFLPSHAPLAAFCTTRGNWSVWTQARATAALRGVMALVVLPAGENALYFPAFWGRHLPVGGGGRRSM